MPTENCYRCGKPLDGYLHLLCDECRKRAEDTEAAEAATGKET